MAVEIANIIRKEKWTYFFSRKITKLHTVVGIMICFFCFLKKNLNGKEKIAKNPIIAIIHSSLCKEKMI